MSLRWTISLACVFAAMCAAYWATGRPSVEPVTVDAPAGPVFTFPPESIASISVKVGEAEAVEARRTDDDAWELIASHDAIRANNAAWERLAAAAVTVTNERTLETNFEGSGIYGLNPPALSVTIASGDSIEQLDFGDVEPTQTYRYARLASHGIFLTPVSAFEQLNKRLVDLRDRRVFAIGEDGIARIDYEAAANTARPEAFQIAIERNGEDWMIVEPTRVEASPIHAGRLAAALRALAGRSYIDRPTNLADYGLANPFAEISIDANGTTQTLHLGWLDDADQRGGLFAKYPDAPGVFVVDAQLVALLPETVDGMRERRLFTSEASDLRAIVYQDPATAFRLETDTDGAWSLVDPPASDTDSLAVSAFIAVLKRVEALGFPEPGAADPNDARFELSFEFTNGETSTARIGGPIPDTDPVQFYAWQEDGTLVALPLQAVVLLQADPFHFRDRRLLRFEPKMITDIEITLDGSRYRFENAGGRWIVDEPKGLRFDSQDDAQAIVDALTAAKADVLLSGDPDNDLTRLDAPVLEVSVGFADSVSSTETRTRQLRVGALSAPESRQRFARRGDAGETYLVDQSLIDDLRAATAGVISARIP